MYKIAGIMKNTAFSYINNYFVKKYNKEHIAFGPRPLSEKGSYDFTTVSMSVCQ